MGLRFRLLPSPSRPRPLLALALALALLAPVLPVSRGLGAVPAKLAAPLRLLRAVGPEGQGNAAATAAWKSVAAAGAKALPAVLEAMDGTNDYALNWLRSAVETIAQREAAAGHAFPVTELERFLRDTRHHPRARRLAYDLIARARPDAARALLPSFENDPSNELRRDAVQLLADAAARQAATDQPGAIAAYRRALGLARDVDQVEDLAKKLGALGDKVDLRATFGWVTRWKLVGPFDNTGGAGFARAFPPEQNLDPAAEFDGQSGRVRWTDFESKSDYGIVDFNQPYTPLKSVTGYAFAEFWSDTARTAEVRLGCINGWKVWVNGKFLFGRDEYHRASEIDQYRLPVQLQAGRNVLLVKCCQNEQTEDWAKEWEFQLRLTDEQGTPVRSSR